MTAAAQAGVSDVILCVDHAVCDARGAFALVDDLLECAGALGAGAPPRPLGDGDETAASGAPIDWYPRIPAAARGAGAPMAAALPPPALLACDRLHEEGLGGVGGMHSRIGGGSAEGFDARGGYGHVLATVPAPQTAVLVAAARARGVSLWSLLQAAALFSECALAESARGRPRPHDTSRVMLIVDCRGRLAPPLARRVVASPGSVAAVVAGPIDGETRLWALATALRARAVEAADVEALPRMAALADSPGAMSVPSAFLVNNYGDFEQLGCVRGTRKCIFVFVFVLYLCVRTRARAR